MVRLGSVPMKKEATEVTYMGKVTLESVSTKLDMMYGHSKDAHRTINTHLEKLNGKVERHGKFIAQSKGIGISLGVISLLIGIFIGIIKLISKINGGW